MCSDCLVDQAEVTCDECGGRKLCLECDSHVHQPRSKRRAGHVRHRLEDDSDKQRLVKKVAALSVTEEGSGSISKSMPQKDGGICKLGHRDSVTSEASKSNESNMKCNLEQQPVNEQDRKEPETRRVIKDTEQSVMTGTSAPQEAGLFDAGRSEHTVEHRIPSRSQAPSTAAVSRVERGRCPVCGMSVDVSEAEVLLAAAWEGVKGSMPYLEAAKRALLASRGILHPLNRTLAEVSTSVCIVCVFNRSGPYFPPIEHFEAATIGRPLLGGPANLDCVWPCDRRLLAKVGPLVSPLV